MVAVVYRGQETFYPSKIKAIRAMEEAAKTSQSEDQARYANILRDLDNDSPVATDHDGIVMDDHFDVVNEHGLYSYEEEYADMGMA